MVHLYTNIRIVTFGETGAVRRHRARGLGGVGPGAYEIRGRDDAGAFRVIYVAKFEDAVYVLHAFQKKTRRTSQADIELAAARYKSIGAKA